MKASAYLAAGISLLLASGTSAAVITGITSVKTPGSNYDLLGGAFDAQPTDPPAAGSVGPKAGEAFGGFHGNAPAIGIDFGENFATQTFTDVLIQQGSYGTANMVIDYYWSSDTAYDEGTDTPAPNLNLFNYSGYGNTTNGRWDLQYSNPLGVTPHARYLLGVPVSGSQGNFNYEIVFLNNIPEPALLGAFGSLGILLASRRRRLT